MARSRRTQNLVLLAFFTIPIAIALLAWRISDIALPEDASVAAERSAVGAVVTHEIMANPRAIEFLGTPIALAPSPNYPVYDLEGVRHAAIATRITGAKDSGTLVGMAQRIDGKWQILRLMLEIPALGERVSFGSSPP